MTTPNLTAPQRRALLWLAETPGEWRMPPAYDDAVTLCWGLGGLVHAGLAGRKRLSPVSIRTSFKLTPAGIRAAKELGV